MRQQFAPKESAFLGSAPAQGLDGSGGQLHTPYTHSKGLWFHTRAASQKVKTSRRHLAQSKSVATKEA